MRAAACALLALAACAPAPIAVLDLTGGTHTPLAVPAGSVHVLVFTSHECPIANAYAPTLRDLATAWRDRPVRLFLVHVDPDLTAAAAATHARQYELPGTIVLDPCHDLARALGIQRTPEAAVLIAAGGPLFYRGRIDDQWRALGSRAPEPGQRDLAAAVDAALA
ncbi:MAG: redoxin domain-containing protein, partial [Planctomycetota bacterium]